MMIGQHPNVYNPIGSFHLVLAVLLAFLTVYPYIFYHNHKCCSVAAYSASDLNLKHELIDSFDIIQCDDILWSRSIDRRGIDDRQQPHDNELDDSDQLNAILTPKQRVKRLQFSSLGRRFNLILTEPSHLITDDFSIVTMDAENNPTRIPFNRDALHVLDGYLESDKNSNVTVAFNIKEKLITAQIKTGSDILIVEPTYLHKENLRVSKPETLVPQDRESLSLHNFSSNVDYQGRKLLEDTMIVYNLQDHKQFQQTTTSNSIHQFQPESLCASVDITDTLLNQANSSNSTAEQINPELEDTMKFRATEKVPSHRLRTKRGIEYLTEQARDRTRCTLHLVADYLFYKHVGKSDLQTTINYLLALINRVNRIYLQTVWDTGDESSNTFKNMGFTVQNITIHQDFTRTPYGDVHYNMQNDKVWAAREYLENFSKNSPPRHYCLAHLLTYRQFDSPVLGLAYVASARHGTIGGICSPTQQRDNFLLKHNTGISTSKGINGETLITRQADLVVAHELGHNLGAEHDSNECRPSPSQGGAYLMHPFAVMGFERNNRFLSNCSRMSIGRVLKRKAPTCFVGVIDHICGNGIREDDEECDGGGLGYSHNDPCCDSYCRFTPGSQCSDRDSLCCNNCQIVQAGIQCKPAEDYNCKQASICNGTSATCPDPPPAEENKVCVGRGLCQSGECTPFCEAKKLYSCLCKTASTACKLCCKTSPNATDCKPYDERAPYLPDGLLCYRGVCEKGRCEQPIQDVVERLWDVLEDINLTNFVKFLRDNIILVVLVVSIPAWCIFSHFINEFDKRIKNDVINAILRNSKNRKSLPSPSPFLPRLFVGDDLCESIPGDDTVV